MVHLGAVLELMCLGCCCLVFVWDCLFSVILFVSNNCLFFSSFTHTMMAVKLFVVILGG